MAGSYRHIVDKDNNFRGVGSLDNLGDAYEALEECYDMIKYLTAGDKRLIHRAWKYGHIDKRCPGRIREEPLLFTDAEFWDEDE